VRVDKLDAMQVFVRLVEKGSFSAVAKERGVGQPAVSKQISALEDELGTELIHRTSRSIVVTEAGHDFTSLLRGYSMTLSARLHELVEDRRRQRD